MSLVMTLLLTLLIALLVGHIALTFLGVPLSNRVNTIWTVIVSALVLFSPLKALIFEPPFIYALIALLTVGLLVSNWRQSKRGENL